MEKEILFEIINGIDDVDALRLLISIAERLTSDDDHFKENKT